MLPSRRSLVPWLLLLVAGFWPGVADADDPKPEPAPPKEATGKEAPPPGETGKDESKPAGDAKPEEVAKAPPTVAVEKGPFVVVLDLAGVFEPEGAAEVKYEPDVYGGELEVLESVPAGPVEAGQVLLRLSTEKIDEQLQNTARDLEIAKRGHLVQLEDAKRAQESSEVAVERAKAEKDHADRALKTFLETDRELRTKESAQRMQSIQDSIKDQEEELAQLEKMYKADDVTEETEDIVMKRAKRQLERSKLGRDFQLVRQRYLLENELPEEERGLKLNARKEAVELDKLVANASTNLERARLEVEKAASGLAKQVEGFEKLKQDREKLVLKAPRAGFAIPGACVRGKWGGVDETARSLEKGGKVRANAPLYTIVEPGSVTARTAVAEAAVLSVRAGLPAELLPAADPAKTLTAKVSRVARVATEGGFEVLLALDARDERLMPGFTCKVKLKTVEKADALTVPAASVGTDGDKTTILTSSPTFGSLMK